VFGGRDHGPGALLSMTGSTGIFLMYLRREIVQRSRIFSGVGVMFVDHVAPAGEVFFHGRFFERWADEALAQPTALFAKLCETVQICAKVCKCLQ
jgi:hypothetical protein